MCPLLDFFIFDHYTFGLWCKLKTKQKIKIKWTLSMHTKQIATRYGHNVMLTLILWAAVVALIVTSMSRLLKMMQSYYMIVVHLST